MMTVYWEIFEAQNFQRYCVLTFFMLLFSRMPIVSGTYNISSIKLYELLNFHGCELIYKNSKKDFTSRIFKHVSSRAIIDQYSLIEQSPILSVTAGTYTLQRYAKRGGALPMPATPSHSPLHTYKMYTIGCRLIRNSINAHFQNH